MPLSALRGFFSDQTYQSRYFDLGSRRALLKPWMLVGRVIDDEIDDHADPALLRSRG